MAEYSLKCFVESGNSYKPALMLQLCGADWEPVWIDYFNGISRSPEFREENVMGEAPVLIDHTQDDKIITQSGVILLHLADRFKTFVPDNRSDELDMLRWMFFDNHKLTSYIATYRFLLKFANMGEKPETEFFKGRAISALKVLEKHLQGRDWITTTSPTLADISMCGYLYWPDHYGMSWDSYPNIKQWLSNIQNIPNWASPEDLLPAGPSS